MARRALLLNPPSTEAVIRDYYCSKTTKTGYLYSPVDLLVQSGRLSRRGEVAVIDAVADRLSEEECLRRAVALRPDGVFFLTGAVSWPADLAFLARLKAALPEAVFVGSGDIFLEDAEGWLAEHPFLDAVALDFTNDDVGRLFAGERDALENAVYRGEGGVVRAARPTPGRRFELPVPRHELFANPRYGFPFARKKPFAVVLTDYGCPYPCGFCVMSGLAFKTRPVENVRAELAALAARGVRELFFVDQTFGLDRARGLELCAALEAEGCFGWTAFARADLVDARALAAWKDAGCHTLIFGAEFGDEALLKAYDKRSGHAELRRGLALAREAGLRTVGTFIIGVPEETRESARRTADLACELPLDFASFNVAVPKQGTALRRRAAEAGPLPATMDQSGGAQAALATRGLTPEQVRREHRRAVLRFYLRPGLLWRRLTGSESWFELGSQAAEGLSLLRRAAW